MSHFKKDVLMGIDLGATGIKAGIFSIDGFLIATASRRNGPVPQPGGKEGWLIWDAEAIWDKVCECTRDVIQHLDSPSQIRGVSVCGFGVDGAPVDRSGRLLYPLSSWHDSRNLEETAWLTRQIPPLTLYKITGFHNYSIQTINRLRWLKVHEPDVLKKAYRYLMTHDFLINRLSGEFTTDVTMASTTTALDVRQRRWSSYLLDIVGVDEMLFPEITQSGTVVGKVTREAEKKSGILRGTPVVTGGHDCEIGALGAGVSDPTTFVDITGTWEMIIAVLDFFKPNRALFDAGIDWEIHCLPNQYLCQSLMIAGGVIEWVGANLFSDVAVNILYPTMVSEAGEYNPGAGGIAVLPSFMRGMGPFQKHHSLGTILGLTTTTTRGQIVRAVFESTCYQLARQIKVIEENTGSICKRLRSLGGAQKNEFWLQMKADVTGLPVEVIQNPEVTLLGTAILAGIGAGVYKDAKDAFSQIAFPIVTYKPNKTRHEEYQKLYNEVFSKIPKALEKVYKGI